MAPPIAMPALFTAALQSTNLTFTYEETAPADMYLSRKVRLNSAVASTSVSGNNTAGRYATFSVDDIGPAVLV